MLWFRSRWSCWCTRRRSCWRSRRSRRRSSLRWARRRSAWCCARIGSRCSGRISDQSSRFSRAIRLGLFLRFWPGRLYRRIRIRWRCFRKILRALLIFLVRTPLFTSLSQGRYLNGRILSRFIWIAWNERRLPCSSGLATLFSFIRHSRLWLCRRS